MNAPTPVAGGRGAGPALADFAQVREDILRLSDLDFQLHVTNAAFTALLANARFDFLKAVVRPHLPEGTLLVIARLEVDFTGEMQPGPPVFTGSRIVGWGRTSMRLEQAIFQAGRCAARALCVFVHRPPGAPAAPWPADLAARIAAAHPGAQAIAPP